MTHRPRFNKEVNVVGRWVIEISERISEKVFLARCFRGQQHSWTMKTGI